MIVHIQNLLFDKILEMMMIENMYEDSKLQKTIGIVAFS